MIEVEVDAARLARSRFAVSPLAELTNALEVLTHPARAPYAGRWVSEVAQRLVWSDYGLLLSIVEAATDYVPDFLVPIPDGPDPDVEAEVGAVAATPPRRVLDELGRAFRLATSGGDGSGARPVMPRAVARVLDADGPEELARQLAGQLLRFWRQEMSGLWEGLRRVLEEDTRQRAVTAATKGFGSVVDDLHPDLTWDGGVIRMTSAHRVRFAGESGVVLVPSAFLPRPALWVGPGRTAMIGYPALGRGRVWLHSADERPLGSERSDLGLFAGRWALLLRDLGVPRSTVDLAVRHGISPSTASYHLGRLHRAGLVTRRRDGRRVLYQRTARATDTLEALDVG